MNTFTQIRSSRGARIAACRRAEVASPGAQSTIVGAVPSASRARSCASASGVCGPERRGLVQYAMNRENAPIAIAAMS
ncbi:hypothetical protein [Brachybacterium sp. GPGPB12]|uniref:hypothetical protein n=1 Tax=Brachybacterium sp. GPGPB12 TaxID=3023517 RepID=UPI003134513E